jgi:hypothetical protein
MGINILLIALVAAAAILAYFSISVSTVMVSVNLIAIAFVIGVEVVKLMSPDDEYKWAENRKFAFIHLSSVIVAANLSVLLLLKNL